MDGPWDPADAAAFAAGLTLRDGTACLPAKLEITSPGAALVTIREGKYHQVKRMCAAAGKPVTALKRLSMGGVTLDPQLAPGQWRELTRSELASLAGSRL